MRDTVPNRNLPILLGAIRQEHGNGELILDQNDGVRRLYLSQGELIHLKSEVAGEQFGSYLMRQGTLDFPSLRELLDNAEGCRLGEKAVNGGMLSLAERDSHLQALQEQILVNALEHPILNWTWNADSPERRLSQDLRFELMHRHCIWRSFQESGELLDLQSILETETTWEWAGRGDLLDTLGDLPLTPGTAYALAFLTADPINFETFRFLSNLDAHEAGRFIATLWALGALVRSGGELPPVTEAAAPAGTGKAPLPLLRPSAKASPGALPLIMPPANSPFGPPKRAARVRRPAPVREAAADPEPLPLRHSAADLPPCGPRPKPLAIEPAAGPWRNPNPPEPIPLATRSGQPASKAPLSPGEAPSVARQVLYQSRKLLGQARHQALLDRTVEAVHTLEEAVKLQPEGEAAYEAWLLLGQLRMLNPAWSTRAILALQRAAAIRPKAADPWTAMGELYHRKGFESDAVTCFLTATRLDPSVVVPQDVDLDGAGAAAEADSPRPKGVLRVFRAILGRVKA